MRSLSTTMQAIFEAKTRMIDYTLDLLFPDGTSLHFATSPLTLIVPYTNDLETVSEIRQTLESVTDQVSVTLQNKDRILGLHVANYWQKWQKAQATVGRLYQDGDGSGLQEWKEMFRGAVQQPNADDFKVSFSIIADTISPGQIICNRTLAAICGFVFKDPKTCAYTGSDVSCNHHLRSKLGCDGKSNSHHYGGKQHRYLPEQQVPGTGGNTGGGGIYQCPRLDQYVIVLGDDGKPLVKMVCFLLANDFLYHPIRKTFHKIKTAKVIKNVEIWETLADNGSLGFSSGSHLLIENIDDEKGLSVDKYAVRQNVLSLINCETLSESKITFSKNTGEFGDVMYIEMEDGHIYAAGDSPQKMFVCHNSKNPIDLEIINY